jgi:glyoxylase-like metal-dependent hydrolase (beta-lactamase superfamily II)
MNCGLKLTAVPNRIGFLLTWTEQTTSLENLAAHRFEWLLPGHGWPVYLPAPEMHDRLVALAARMPQI